MTVGSHASLLYFAPHHGSGLCTGFAWYTPPPLAPVFSFPARALRLCPHSSVCMRCRNLNLLSIDYAFRPRLRSRLTQGRSALPWKPRIFGRKDSHLPLATHSGILSPKPSTAPFGTASSVFGMLLYHSYIRMNPKLRCRVLAPVHFRRRTSRLVSCYALFECMAASEPTS